MKLLLLELHYNLVLIVLLLPIYLKSMGQGQITIGEICLKYVLDYNWYLNYILHKKNMQAEQIIKILWIIGLLSLFSNQENTIKITFWCEQTKTM